MFTIAIRIGAPRAILGLKNPPVSGYDGGFPAKRIAAKNNASKSSKKTGAAVVRERAKGTFALVSLGCPKNLVDAECMAGQLKEAGYRMLKRPDGVDFVLINTCGFIGDARKESYDAIEEMIGLKNCGFVKGVIVAGCLAERDREKMLERYPGIDQMLGVFGRDDVVAAVERFQTGFLEQRAVFRPAPSQPLHDDRRLRITPRHLAFLKIAEGCNRLCAFCSIPLMRGPYASKPLEEITVEAEKLAADGVQELIVIAQDTTFYGMDNYGKPMLAEALRRLNAVEGFKWIRLMYLYPMHVDDELLDVIADSEKILPYVDIPLQHINDDVLRRMRRRVDRAATLNLLEKMRAKIPSLAIRTTLITGFPGETEEQFEELRRFVADQKFERLGAFAYCEEPGTAAAELDGKISEEEKLRRRDALLAVQQPIVFERNESLIGAQADVIIDSAVPKEKNAFVGRTYADAPEIDGVVYVTGEKLKTGDIVKAEIVGFQDYDLIAAAVE